MLERRGICLRTQHQRRQCAGEGSCIHFRCSSHPAGRGGGAARKHCFLSKLESEDRKNKTSKWEQLERNRLISYFLKTLLLFWREGTFPLEGIWMRLRDNLTLQPCWIMTQRLMEAFRLLSVYPHGTFLCFICPSPIGTLSTSSRGGATKEKGHPFSKNLCFPILWVNISIEKD